MAWGFLTNHAQALLCIAQDPGVRLREIATTLGITERAAFGIVTDLVEAGYVLKDRHGRRNHYRVQLDQPLPEALLRQRTVGQLLDLLATPKKAPATTPEALAAIRSRHRCRAAHRASAHSYTRTSHPCSAHNRTPPAPPGCSRWRAD